jgi:hypothetical protein
MGSWCENGSVYVVVQAGAPTSNTYANVGTAPSAPVVELGNATAVTEPDTSALNVHVS